MSDYTEEPPERHSLMSELETSANGYTQAVQPLNAHTLIVTDTQGLRSGEIRISTESGDIPAYYAAPDDAIKHPIVLVAHEVFGLHEHIKDVTRRLAKSGCIAVAVDLFARQGNALALKTMDEARQLAARVPDAQILSDLDAALAWAEQNGGDGDRALITGFCWGGRIVWLYAAHQPKLKAAVAWYGRLTGDANDNQREFPLQITGRLKAPVLGLYGVEDEYITLEHVERMQAALNQNHGESKIQLYPEAGHGFFADYRGSYRPQAAEDAWHAMLNWFAVHTAPKTDSADNPNSNQTWEAD